MHCIEFRTRASLWLDGERPANATAHLDGCAGCRAVVADLELIRDTARALPESDREAPERVWTNLRLALEAEGLVRTARPAREAAGWWSVFSRPALAGAYLSIVLLGAMLLGMQTQPTAPLAGVPAVPGDLLVEVPMLRAAIASRAVSAMHEHNPVVTASYRQSLSAVDNFIALCEKTVREDPQNELARDYLYGAYQQKAELLAMITERGARGD